MILIPLGSSLKNYYPFKKTSNEIFYILAGFCTDEDAIVRDGTTRVIKVYIDLRADKGQVSSNLKIQVTVATTMYTMTHTSKFDDLNTPQKLADGHALSDVC